MAKFPSQRKLQYQTGGISTAATAGGSGTWTTPTSGTVTGHLNLPKDLSLLNRRGYASTTRKGVPLIYQCKIDFFLHDEDGVTSDTAFASDAQAVLKVDGCQNNWVMRNAAVKFHAAREKMYADAGIRKRDRGAYSHEIRYNYDSSGDTWLVPIDGDGDAFTGGTWDQSELAHAGDSSVYLKLVGAGIDEQAADDAAALQIGFSYLSSRGTVAADSNLESDSALARFSILENMLSEQPTATSINDDVRDAAKGEGDNPPYDEWASDDVNHDITEPVELGRAVAGLGNAYGSTIVEVPFGLADLKVKIDQASAFSMTPSGLICVEVLDIFEMQG